MTRKDFELIASVLADAESFLVSDFAIHGSNAEYVAMKQVHDRIRNRFIAELASRHPRFNAARFDIASRPIHHAELKQEILRKLDQS